MIASRSLNFIFIKTRKTGGTSLEIVLSSWCGEEDVCAPIHRPDEAIRAQYGGVSRNFADADGKILFTNHMTARAVKRALPDLWRTAFKFTVERHPYEKVVSRASWNIAKRRGDPRDFKREIEEAIASGAFLNHQIYTIGGRVAVDEIVPYESMWQRVAELGRSFGKALPAEQPRAKGGLKLDQRPAAEVLTPDQKRRVYEMARFEFDIMGYEP